MSAIAPPNPSKWEIIPIHTSDRGTFKSCRRQWAWSSPSRLNLVPKASVHGIVMPLWFGTGIHFALQQYYHPVLKQDPVVSWEAWYQAQWQGGLVAWNELDQFHDRNPRPDETSGKITDERTGREYYNRYFVRGLQDILMSPDEDDFENHHQIGLGMMKFYKTYAAKEDDFNVIAVEHDFSVPVLTPDGNVLTAVDHRIMPAGYEHLQGLTKEVHVRGRMDAVIQSKYNERYGILDHKTAGRVDEDYFRHIDLDEQCTSYLAYSEVEAKLHDLPYTKVDYIIYQALLKAYPVPPTLTERGGTPSLDRQKEHTTAAMFEKCVKDLGLQVWFEKNEKARLYYEHLISMGDKLFIQREPVYRNRAQKDNAMHRVYLEALDMLNPDLPLYPNPRKEYNCLNCRFRSPCIAAEDGSDYQSMLDDGYESNYDR